MDSMDSNPMRENVPMLVRFIVDFNRLLRQTDGTESILIDAVSAPRFASLDLHEGQRAIFEEPGELQMTGTLHRRAAGGGIEELWEGLLDEGSTVYHIRIEPQTLYSAGPEGCAHYHEWIDINVADAALDTMHASGAIDATDATTSPPAAADAGDEYTGIHSSWQTRARQPARLLTLGVEGTFEQWYRSLADRIPRGEVALVEDDPIVLVDDTRAVDARVRVLRLPPDDEHPAGQRVWLAEPDWRTVRPQLLP